MALGLGHLLDLNRKLKNNKQLLSSKKSKARLKNRIGGRGKDTGKYKQQSPNISDTELTLIKSEIKNKMIKENRRIRFLTILCFILCISVILLIISVL